MDQSIIEFISIHPCWSCKFAYVVISLTLFLIFAIVDSFINVLMAILIFKFQTNLLLTKKKKKKKKSKPTNLAISKSYIEEVSKTERKNKNDKCLILLIFRIIWIKLFLQIPREY